MPSLLEPPPETDANLNPFSDLIPDKSLIGGDNGTPAYQNIAGKFSAVPKAEINTPTAFGAFADLVPSRPNSEAEKALAETPEPKPPAEADTGLIHQTLNAVRVFGNAAGKYIFHGLEGLAHEQAKLYANPTPEMIALQPEAVMLPKEQQDALEQRYIADSQAAVPAAMAREAYFKGRVAGADKQSEVDPALANTIPARLANAAGEATMMGLESLIPGAGVPLMTLHGAFATEAEYRQNHPNAPESEAEAAGIRSAIGLGLFGGLSKVASLGVAKLLPMAVKDPSKLITFVAQFVGQDAANETSSRAIAAWNAASDAPAGQKLPAAMKALGDWNLESGVLNTVYAGLHAAKAAGAVKPKAETPISPASEPVPAPAPESGIAPETARYAKPAQPAAPENRDAGVMPPDARARRNAEYQAMSSKLDELNKDQFLPEPEGNDWTRATEEPTLPTQPETPARSRLLPGETQGDLISSTQAEPFALVGEKGTDHAARAQQAVALEEARLRAEHEQELLTGFLDPNQKAPYQEAGGNIGIEAARNAGERVASGQPETRRPDSVVSPAPEEAPRKFRGPADAFGSEVTPVAAHVINDVGGLMSKSRAKKLGLYQKNPALWDGAPAFDHPTHNKVYNAKGGETPDHVAQSAYEEGLISDPSPDALYAALKKESRTARTIQREESRRVQETPTPAEPNVSRAPISTRPSNSTVPGGEIGDLTLLLSPAEMAAQDRAMGADHDLQAVLAGKHWIAAEPDYGAINEVFADRQSGIDYMNTMAVRGEALIERVPGKPDKVLKRIAHDDQSLNQAKVARFTPAGSYLNGEPLQVALKRGNAAEIRGKESGEPSGSKTAPETGSLSRNRQGTYDTDLDKIAAEIYGGRRYADLNPDAQEQVRRQTEIEGGRVAEADAIKEAGLRLRERAGEAGYADLIPDVIDFGRRIATKGMDFARWSKEMVRHLGEKIKEHLKMVWDAVRSQGDERGGIGGLSGETFGLKISGKRNDLNAATTARSAKLQRSFADSERAQKEINKAVPSKRRQAAITVNIEAAGDPVLLAHWEGAAKGAAFKRAAADAQTLTPSEIAIRDKAEQAFHVLGMRGQRNNAIGDKLRDNYVTHVWNVTKKFSGIGSSKLHDRFKFAKARTFSTLFDGDQAGFVPKTMAIGELLPAYMHELNTVIADRQFVRDVSTGKASNGISPLVARRGAVRDIEPHFGTGGKTYLVDPGAMQNLTDAAGNPIDTSAYKVLPDHHALKDWKFAGQDSGGNPILMKDDLAVHPELNKRLNAMMGQSEIRRWYNEQASGAAVIPRAIAKGLDTAQSVMKREMFGLLAPFHQVQEGTHAIGHSVNPFFGIEDMSRPTPAHIDAMEHGLMLLPEKKSSVSYLEGVGGRNSFLSQISRKFGGPAGRMVADTIDGYQNYLFHQYIPGLKFKTYEHVVTRNMARYAKHLESGEVTKGDVKMLSAEQANAAYGHLNYALLDRNPTIQHFMQLGLLAPDFLEARGRFVGQALKSIGSKAGHEQLRAIATIALVQAGAAYTLAKLLGDDWDPTHPFELTHDGRTYTMRSVPEDLFRLLFSGSDTRREFQRARWNPVLSYAIQAGTGKNYRGEKVGFLQTMGELLANYIPITARSLPGIRSLTETSRNNPISPLEQLAGSLGLRVSRYSPITKTYQLAVEWKKAQGIASDTGVFPVSKYQQLRYALEDGDFDRARAEYQKLINAGEKRTKIGDGFRESILHPFSGSQANDRKFKMSLSPDDRLIYDAAVAKRHEILRRLQAMRAGAR